MSSAGDTGARIERLLGELRSAGGPEVAAAAEELVRLLVGMYGDGLARIVSALRDSDEPGRALLRQLAADPEVEGLLLVHDLHPLDVDARIQQALDRVRPYLGSHAGGVEYLGVADGIARLRLLGSCHGCPSSTVTVRMAIEDAVQAAAPEITGIDVTGIAPGQPELLQIGRRPAEGGGPAGRPTPAGAAAGAGTTWVTLPDIGPPSARPVTASAAGVAVLLCSVRGTLYAYMDACAACGGSLAGGALDREKLSCPGCGTRYDARLAGRGIEDPALHLDPLPLLADSHGVRVAVPEAARA
jgi:Fe-S cluster biogenesis protein NfuA/nitrite reductase/ring-hydroxylating ferredoxin subunit